MTPISIARIRQEIDAVTSILVKLRSDIWYISEQEEDAWLSAAEVAELLDISYKKVAVLTKQGILKDHQTKGGRYRIYKKKECFQALLDNAIWKVKTGNKKPQALKAQGNCSSPQQGDNDKNI